MTLEELNNLCARLRVLRDDKNELEDRVKDLNTDIADVQARILEAMIEHEIPSIKGPFGTISVKYQKTFRQPETMEDKLKLFEYLKEEGIFNDMVKVDSRTLSSWASEEVEARERDGIVGWVPPGLQPPSEFPKISLRINKTK